MNLRHAAIPAFTLALLFAPFCRAQSSGPYLGFDQNLYPGDAALPALRKTFTYTGYWLNVPPSMHVNQWKGKRALLVQNGFGFLVLYNGRIDVQLKGRDPVATGNADAAAAIAAAIAEGFPAHAILFLDLEEGGRMLPRVSKYTNAWVETIRKSSFRPGVYCSGIEVDDDPGVKISTADDVRTQMPDVALWTANDECPPAPGCVLPSAAMRVEGSGRTDALVWQYTQSPRRSELTRRCALTYAYDGNCYAPGLPHTQKTALDLNLSASADPSAGR